VTPPIWSKPPAGAQHGAGRSRNAEIVSWLSELEAHYRYSFTKEAEASEWSRRCIRQADRVLLIARAGSRRRRRA